MQASYGNYHYHHLSEKIKSELMTRWVKFDPRTFVFVPGMNPNTPDFARMYVHVHVTRGPKVELQLDKTRVALDFAEENDKYVLQKMIDKYFHANETRTQVLELATIKGHPVWLPIYAAVVRAQDGVAFTKDKI